MLAGKLFQQNRDFICRGAIQCRIEQLLAIGRVQRGEFTFQVGDDGTGDADLVQAKPDQQGQKLRLPAHFTAQASPFFLRVCRIHDLLEKSQKCRL